MVWYLQVIQTTTKYREKNKRSKIHIQKCYFCLFVSVHFRLCHLRCRSLNPLVYTLTGTVYSTSSCTLKGLNRSIKMVIICIFITASQPRICMFHIDQSHELSLSSSLMLKSQETLLSLQRTKDPRSHVGHSWPTNSCEWANCGRLGPWFICYIVY